MTSTTPGRRQRVADLCARLVGAPWFSLAGFAVIVVNAVALGLETYDSVVATAGGLLHMVEYVCIACFAVELVIRFLAGPAGFFRDRWNLFDLVIVIAPLVPGVRENVTLLRLLRLARIVRTFRLFPSLRVILVGIRRSLPGLGSFLLVTVLLLYGYAILGWMMFADDYPERYGTVGQAMLTLFLLLSLDGITDTLQAGREVTEWAVLYYVSYMVAACYLLTNLLVGLVLTALQEAHADERAAATRPDPPSTENAQSDARTAHPDGQVAQFVHPGTPREQPVPSDTRLDGQDARSRADDRVVAPIEERAVQAGVRFAQSDPGFTAAELRDQMSRLEALLTQMLRRSTPDDPDAAVLRSQPQGSLIVSRRASEDETESV
ncbi:ion transporter [Paractinoplanes bogorensis]|uniref:ion transporter n=1 Tax=Paractinoplanes bogorensis TaxID=1610840 RepID=UPI001FEA0B49|nr:ion transporter [Actinoplanes bogorensis]